MSRKIEAPITMTTNTTDMAIVDADACDDASVDLHAPPVWQPHISTPLKYKDVGQGHPLNALDDTPVESGMMMDDSVPQFANADEPMLVTESGMVTDDRLLHPKKVAELIMVSELDITTVVILRQF